MKRVAWILLVMLAILTAATPFLAEKAEHWWENIPLFWGFYTVFGAALLTVIARGLGKLFIQQPEDHEP